LAGSDAEAGIAIASAVPNAATAKAPLPMRE
jgi:hypothetical protein